MILSLFLSFVCTNFTNPYILFRQPDGRKPTISYNAAQSTSTHLLYIFGHLFGGLFFLIFAYKFFYQELDSNLLWGLAIGGVASKWIQAFIPARKKLEIYHTIFAWGMALFMSAILIAAPLITDDTPALVVSITILVSCAIVTLIVGNQRFWIPQLMYFSLFYVVLVMLAS
jgi:hypothetical protein